MQKRKILIGEYDTAKDGLWTLTAWAFANAEHHQSYADVPGHNGPLDLSTILTDGEPYYGSRAFEATLESSEGTRLEREERISRMINQLDGLRFDIQLPDDDKRYITGRVRIARLYNNNAHASVSISAMCDPWRYNREETVVRLTASSTEETAMLTNDGRRSVVPTIEVTEGTVSLTYTVGTKVTTWSLEPGTHILGDIYLKTGVAPIKYSGAGEITFTYREAVL